MIATNFSKKDKNIEKCLYGKTEALLRNNNFRGKAVSFKPSECVSVFLP